MNCVCRECYSSILIQRKCLGALSDVFHSWNFCWVLEVMLLGALSETKLMLLGALSDVFQSWIFCWVLEMMFFGLF